MPLLNWDERRNVIIPGDKKSTLLFCVDHFLQTYHTAMEQKGFFSVALSGGSTPQALFTLLTHPPFVLQVDWSTVHLFWSDERSVPPDDVESNFHMAMEAGFAPLPIQHIYRMQAEKGEAKAYEQILPKEGLDYIMLGMGEDGHTASLFPNTPALTMEKELVAYQYVPQKDSWRMTFTFPYIHKAKQVVLYVLGKSKAPMVAEIFSFPGQKPSYPVEHIGNAEHKALWILDEDAACLSSFSNQSKTP